jgi:hypothetical protein
VPSATTSRARASELPLETCHNVKRFGAQEDLGAAAEQFAGTVTVKSGTVEREFGDLKHEWALLPLRVRRIQRIKLHVDLTILGRLTVALDKAAHGASCEVAA